MQKVQIQDKVFKLYMDSGRIAESVDHLARLLSTDLAGKEVICLGILNGSFVFASDLLRKLSIPCQMSFVKVSSYHGEYSKGKIDELIGINESLEGACVVIIEDIIDTGLSMDHVYAMVEAKQPAEIRIVTLLFKEEAFKGTRKPNYTGFVIPDRFVIGYGLDYRGFGRNLPDLYQLEI
jgi:hypoxanthine phosphoribosyltransferase